MTPEEDPCQSEFGRDVLAGLSRPQKAIPSRWLYDLRGSELFEQITELEEYYPTRTETAIFHDQSAEIAGALGEGVVLVEYGAGALVKTRILLDALPAPAGYVPIDISGRFLREAAGLLARDYPGLEVHPIVGDFTSTLDLSGAPGRQDQRVGFFPGSTIGNLDNDQIRAFFRTARATLGPDARFILGLDLKKDPGILIPAYDDSSGVTAEFNLNLLARINRELGADFDLENFRHEARWNEAESRVEMHIVARRPGEVTLCGQSFSIGQAETIHTEISRKFELPVLDTLLEGTGWRREETWQDPRGHFAVTLLGPELA